MSDEKKLTKAEQREATIARLVEVGRELFTRAGYAQTATEDIVRAAGVTRGALYHHFSGKEGLFKAVLESIQADVGQRIEQDATVTDDLWEQLLIGCRTFLAASTEPDVQRIMLIDAPAVLGWELWRQIDAENSMKQLVIVLNELVADGTLQDVPVEALTHLLSGAMNEAALWIVQSPDPATALEEASTTLERLLSSLRQA